MTIASEITRLDWAKADIKTAIENKGVSVPSNAKLDTYNTYIDQIDTWVMFMDKLTLKEYRIDTNDSTPGIGGRISWNDNTGYYSAIIATTEKTSGQSTYYYYLVWVKKTTGSDIQYFKGNASAASSIHGSPRGVVFYKKAWAIRAFFYEISTYTTNWVFWYQADWNLSNNSITVTYLTRNESTSLPQEADTTGYTETSASNWVDTVTGTNTNDNSNIYLTLK